MGDLKRFLEESPMAAGVSLPTTIVLHRSTLNPSDVEQTIERGSLVPVGESTCDLEIGGQCVARGRVVRRRGDLWFKVTEMAALGSAETPPAGSGADTAAQPSAAEGGVV